MTRLNTIVVVVVVGMVGGCMANCPLFWYEEGTHCLEKKTNYFTHQEAVDKCKEAEAELVSVTDMDIAEMLKEIVNEDQWYWTSGKDEHLDQDWRWHHYSSVIENVDWSPHLEFKEYSKNMISNHPVNASNNCVMYNLGEGLKPASCTTELHAVCYKSLDKNLCPPGYGIYGARCISDGRYEHTYDEAKQICQHRSGELLEPHTPWEMDETYSVLDKYNWKYDAFVGIVYKNNAWRFESDNQEVPGTFWDADYPTMVEDQKCAVYRPVTRRLMDVDCQSLQYYMCVYRPKPQCPPGYLSFGWSSECFLLPSFKLTFKESKKFCNSWGGQVASLRDTYHKYRLYSFLALGIIPHTGDISVWMDLNDYSLPGQFQFSDGTKMQPWTLSDFSPAPPNLGQCTYMFSSSDTSYFTSTSCIEQNYPLCIAHEGDCPMGFKSLDGECFRFSQELISWANASERCQLHSSELAWTLNQDTMRNKLCLDNYRGNEHEEVNSYWLGGTDEGHEGQWSFPDSTTSLYASDSTELEELWLSGEPSGAGNCMMMNGQGYVADAVCSDQKKYICQAPKNLQVMLELLSDLYVLEPKCYKEDVFSLQFQYSPGHYDATQLSLSLCALRCNAVQYKYAATTMGIYCFCSNILALEVVDTTLCNVNCSDTTSNEYCGSVNGQYISVIRASTTAAAAHDVGMANQASLNASETVDVEISTNITFSAIRNGGGNANISVQFGDGNAFSITRAIQYSSDMPPAPLPVNYSYIFNIPGIYRVSVKFSDPTEISEPEYATVTVNVSKMPLSPVILDCPVVVLPGEIFICNITIFVGHNLVFTVDKGDGSENQKYLLPAPKLESVGDLVPQSPLEDMVEAAVTLPSDISTPNSNASINDTSSVEALTPLAVVMPSARVKQDSVLIAFSAYVVLPGDITFMILQPSCSERSLCQATGRCEVECPSKNSSAFSCPTGTFCVHGHSCISSSSASTLTMCGASEGFVPDVYTVLVSETVPATLGYNYFELNQTQHMWPSLKAGDVLGWKSSAVIAHYLSEEESDIGYTDDTNYNSETQTILGVRHYVSATISLPVTTSISNNYPSIGNYTFNISVESDLAKSSNSCVIAVQIPIVLDVPEVPVFDPPHIAYQNCTTVIIPVISGSDIQLMFDWGDGNIVWKHYVGPVTSNITEEYCYGKVGKFDIVIKIFNHHTIEGGIPFNQWIFNHSLYCQHPCNMALWTFESTQPALIIWPKPADVEFTVAAPSGVQLPTNSTITIDFQNGVIYGKSDTIGQPEYICGGSNDSDTTSCSDGYSYTSTQGYSEDDTYNVTFRCKNLISNFLMVTPVTIYGQIRNLSGSTCFVPFLPFGGTDCIDGQGENKIQFPIERPVSFSMEKRKGTVFSYFAELANGTFLSNSTSDRVDVKFYQTGMYNVCMYASNPLQPRSEPTCFEVEVVESVVDVKISDYYVTTPAMSSKPFLITWKSEGTFSCFILDYGDNSQPDAWQSDKLERKWNVCDNWMKTIGESLGLKGSVNRRGALPEESLPLDDHVYETKGYYTVRLFGMNFLSQSKASLNITVTSTPCTPPLVYLKENATEFFESLKVQRSQILRVESVCKLDCNQTLITVKHWKGVGIDPGWGTEIANSEVDMSGWDCRNKSILFIPPLTLEYGIYRFTYFVNITGNATDPLDASEPFVRATDTYINITKTPLVLKMTSGGVTKITRGFNQTITVDMSANSVDPDFPGDKNFECEWFCHRIHPNIESLLRDSENHLQSDLVSNPLNSLSDVFYLVYSATTNTTITMEYEDKGGCFGDGPGKINITGCQLDLNTLQLRATNTTYRITGTIKKDTRRAESYLDCEIVPGSPPVIDIKCQFENMCRITQGGVIVNPSGRVALESVCTDYCSDELKYAWSIITLVNGVKSLITDGTSYMIGHDKPKVVIQKTLFIDHPTVLEFHIKQIISRLVDNEGGVGTMVLKINKPPGGGTCTLTPPPGRVFIEENTIIDPETGYPRRTGRALTEDFYIECKNYVDPQDDKISQYSFSIRGVGLHFEKILKFGIDTKDKFVFPLGCWDLWVKIEDEWGAFIKVNIGRFCTSLPSRRERREWNKRQELERALGEGNQARISQLSIAETSIANKELSDDPWEITTTTPASPQEDVKTTTMDPELQKAIEKKKKIELDKIQTEAAKFKKRMFKNLESNNVDNLDDCTQQMSTVSAIIGDGDTIDLNGRDMAVDMLCGKCMTMILLNTSLIDPAMAEGYVGSTMQGISSLIKSNSKKVIGDMVLAIDVQTATLGDYSSATEVNSGDQGTIGEDEELSKEKTLGLQKTKAMEHGAQSLRSADLAMNKLLSIVYPGEEPVTIVTEDGLVMTLAIMYGHTLKGYELWQGGGLYILPDLCDILKEEKVAPGNCSSTEKGTSVYGIQAIAWMSIVQSYGDGAKDKLSHNTKTMQIQLVEISDTGVELVPVEDLDPESEVIIYVPRLNDEGKAAQKQKGTFIDPNSLGVQCSPMCCIKFNMTDEMASINFAITIGNPDSQLALFLRKKKKPTFTEYDSLVNLNSVESVKNVSEVLLEPYDLYGNDTNIYTFLQYEIFTPLEFENESYNYFACVAEFGNNTETEIFWEEPDSYNLTEANMTGAWTTNYTFMSYTSSCLFYSDAINSWQIDGCRVVDANFSHTVCSCNHLTSFGSGLFPQPNKIDWNAILNMKVSENPTIVITMIVTVAVFMILLIWGRYKDKEDLTKLGASPLPDNDPRDKYLYEVMVFTGGKEEASTTSKVQFILTGERSETDVRTFADPERLLFKRNAIDIFVMTVPECLGNIQFLRIWHDNSGKDSEASWYLRYIVFRDVQTGQKFEFIANCWFAVEHDDFQIDRLIAVAGEAQKTEFKHLFDTRSHKNLYDGHLWFSVFARPARSRFTRVQRITSCMALLYLSMAANAMFYGVIPEEPGAGGIQLGPFSMSPAAIGVGIISNLVTFPPTFIIIQLFRKVSPKFKRVSRIQKAMIKQREQKRREFEEQKKWRLLKGKTDTEDEGGSSHRPSEPAHNTTKKKVKQLPWWMLYIAWLVAVLTIIAGGCFTFFYGVSFGEEEAAKWLSGLFISFFSSVLCTQPIQVFAMAMIFSAICKKPNDDEDDADRDESDPELGEDEEWMHELGDVHRKKMEYKPVDDSHLLAAREQRKKEIKMWGVIYDMGAYAFFIWIVIILSHGNRDPNSFLLKNELANNFIYAATESWTPNINFLNIQNKSYFYHWMRVVFAEEIKMTENYNGILNPKHDNELMLNDGTSLLLGYATLRQVRIEERTCKIPRAMKNTVKVCRGKTTLIDEEKKDFDVSWRPLPEKKKPKFEYKYRGALELDTVPFWGNIDVYGGGGYQVKLTGRKDKLLATIDGLEKDNWINERTRAVFIEFSIYNAQVNLFAACVIVLEQGPEGGLHPSFKIDPIMLLRYNEGFSLFVMICEGVFIVFIIYYTYREFKGICRDKRTYWKDPWNYLELIVISLGWSAIVFYAMRTALGMSVLSKFKETEGKGYIRLDYVASINEIFLYIVSFLVFFATLKFLKLLKFNKRMGFLTSTLKQCASDLSGFVFTFMLTFLAFGQLFYLLHNSNHYDYKTFMTSVEATFSAMLGKFDYRGVEQSSPGIGPVAFFIFAFLSTIIMVNLLLTLVIRGFQEIKHDLLKQSNDYEIVDFMVNKARMAVGLAPKMNFVGPLHSTTEDAKENNTSTKEFPEKVDQLLSYINELYFDSKLEFNNLEWLKYVSKQTREPHTGVGTNTSDLNNEWPPEDSSVQRFRK